MKKFFTLAAAVVAALSVNAATLVFSEAKSAGELNGVTLGSGNLTLSITDTSDPAKVVIDANKTKFGDAAGYWQSEYRLKTGGKSSATNALTLHVGEAGTLYVYARTGSGSATDRSIVLTQNGTELLNHILLDSEVSEITEGESTVKVFPIYSVSVSAGDVEVAYPVGSVNIYGFSLNETLSASAGGNPDPVNPDPVNPDPVNPGEVLTGTEFLFNNLTAADFTNLVNCEPTTYTMDGVDGPAMNYTGSESALMEFDCRGVHFSYKNSSTANNAVKTGADFIQFDKKNFVITISGLKANAKAQLYVSAKGSTAAKFNAGTKADAAELGTAEKAASMAEYTLINAQADANGVIEVKEVAGGFRMSKIVVEGVVSALEEISVEAKAVKVIENGKLYIIRNGVKFNAAGMIVK